MEIRVSGRATIKHQSTGDVYEIEEEELSWDCVGGGEDRGMGPEEQYEASVDHPQLGNLSWSIWEYPVGVESYKSTNVGPHELIEDFDYGLEHSEPDAFDILDQYSIPENAFSIFMDSYHHTGDLLADHGDDLGDQLINRMIFSQQIGAMEAYLSDTILKKAKESSKIRNRLILQDKDLSKEKFTLEEIDRTSDFVKAKVLDHLTSVMYHNLKKVEVLYNIAFGFRFLDLTPNADDLFRAIILRHDCVHRNGHDKDGNKILIFSKVFVQETADKIKYLVEQIENTLNQQA